MGITLGCANMCAREKNHGITESIKYILGTGIHDTLCENKLIILLWKISSVGAILFHII